MEGTPHPLKAYRTSNGLTQQGLADLLDVERTTVARWECGDRQIDKELVPKVSQITGIAKRELRPDLAVLLDEASETPQ